MVFAPTRSATEMSPIHPEAQADGDVGTTQPISTTASSQFSPVYTSSTPMATHAQGNYVPGFPVGWDPTTGFGMHPEYMLPSSVGQPGTSASQPMNQQINASTPQPSVTTASVPSPASPNNMSAPWLTPQQQNLAMMK